MIQSKASIKRRDLLRLSAAAIPGVAASARAGGSKKSVIVMGAGIAGLSCAYELVRRGHQVTVLEASGRPGGHVRTLHDPFADGLYADMGAEHFYYPGYTQYWRYLHEFGLTAIHFPRRENLSSFSARREIWRGRSSQPRGAGRSSGSISGKSISWQTGPGRTFRCCTAKAMSIGCVMRPIRLSAVWSGWIISRSGFSETRKCLGRRCGVLRRFRFSAANDLGRRHQEAAGHGSRIEKAVSSEGRKSVDDRCIRRAPGRKGAPRLPGYGHSNTAPSGASVTYREFGQREKTGRRLPGSCISLVMLRQLPVTPAWPDAKAFVIREMPYYTRTRIVFQCRSRFWKTDNVSPNWLPPDPG